MMTGCFYFLIKYDIMKEHKCLSGTHLWFQPVSNEDTLLQELEKFLKVLFLSQGSCDYSHLCLDRL